MQGIGNSDFKRVFRLPNGWSTDVIRVQLYIDRFELVVHEIYTTENDFPTRSQFFYPYIFKKLNFKAFIKENLFLRKRDKIMKNVGKSVLK